MNNIILIFMVSLFLMGCGGPPPPKMYDNDTEVQVLVTRDCLDRISQGPKVVSDDNDWEDVIESCVGYGRSVSSYCSANCVKGDTTLINVQKALLAFKKEKNE